MTELVESATPMWKMRLTEVTDRFRALPNNKKFVFFAALAALLAVIVGAVAFNRDSAYKPLFANLSDRDGGQITAALQQMNVPYQIANGGVISVPADKIYDVRLRLAAQGLPKAGGVGFELMDNQKFGISQFAEQVNYQRAIEGELARTIESIQAVESARVHIAVPTQSVFLRDQQLPTASVMLTLYPGRLLDGGQIAGIINLVSSAIPGLTAKNVTVLDQDGTLLSKIPDMDNASGLNQRQLHYVRQFEEDYVKRIEAILEPLFGKGNARAQVTAQLDFSDVEQTSESYRPNSSPNPSATRSQQIVEKLASGPPAAAGVPGALTNQPPSAASAPITLPPGALPGTQTISGQPVSPNAALERDITTNYELDKTIQHTKLPKGVLRRVSAAVVVNYRTVLDRAGSKKPTPLTAEEMQQVNNLVKEAIGYNSQRGDTLNVVNAAFANAVPAVALQDKFLDYANNYGWPLLKYLLLGVLILWLALGVVRPIVREIVNPSANQKKGDLTDSAETEAETGGRLLAVAGDEESEASLEEESDLRAKQQKQYEANLEAARQQVLADPYMAAQIIREWVNADE